MMNIYVVVEGQCEKKVYGRWVPLVNPSLTLVENIEEMDRDNFIIFSAQGFPQINEMIAAGIEDARGHLTTTSKSSFDKLRMSGRGDLIRSE